MIETDETLNDDQAKAAGYRHRITNTTISANDYPWWLLGDLFLKVLIVGILVWGSVSLCRID